MPNVEQQRTKYCLPLLSTFLCKLVGLALTTGLVLDTGVGMVVEEMGTGVVEMGIWVDETGAWVDETGPGVAPGWHLQGAQNGRPVASTTWTH